MTQAVQRIGGYFIKSHEFEIILLTSLFIYFSISNSYMDGYIYSGKELSTSKHGKDFSLLKDPPARPHIEAPPTIIRAPANQITTVTRVTIPSDNQCEDGSKLCVIL